MFFVEEFQSGIANDLHSSIAAEAMSSAKRGKQTAMDKLHLTMKCCYKTISTFKFVLFP